MLYLIGLQHKRVSGRGASGGEVLVMVLVALVVAIFLQ